MNRWIVMASAAGAAATLLPLPAPAQQAAPTAAEAPINFAQYRDFRLEIITRREEALALGLADPGLSPVDKTRLEGQKTYWDRWAKLPATERDRLFRERFDEIDRDRDGTIDAQERAAWRAHQQDYYRQLAAARARPAEPH